MEWLASHFDLIRPGFWLCAAVGLAVLATNLAWLVVHVCEQLRLERALRLLRADAVQAVAWLIASAWLLAPPFYAWRAGAISPYHLGVAELDWIASLSAGGWPALLIVAVAMFGWLIYRHTLPADSTGAGDESRLILALRAAIEAGLTQWHLAFCRAALIGWLSASPVMPALPAAWAEAILRGVLAQPFYWGSWLGLSVALFQAGLNPFVRDALSRPSPRQHRQGRPEALLRDLALAFATTGLFVLARNFWLCLICHVVISTTIAGWLPVRQPLRVSEH